MLLVYPRGPFWSKKDNGAWSIPKGEFTNPENSLDAAIREFHEETGQILSGIFIILTPVKLKSGKIVYPFAHAHDFDTSKLISNTFTLEWPPRSGIQKEFPEVDKSCWFNIVQAKQKINQTQAVIIDELISQL